MKSIFKNLLVALGFISLMGMLAFLAIVVLIAKNLGSGDLPSMMGDSKNQVGIVELQGEISSSRDIREKLEKFVKDDKIKAIVIAIDSPGGAVGASEEIYKYIVEAGEKKPVVCSLGNVAASGGLYSSMGCKKVYTQAGTMTGSIGVILMMPNFKAVMDKFGVQFNIIKSGALKDSGTPFREFTEEDKSFLQSVAMEAYNQFITTVSTRRNIPIEKVKEFADGRIILGETSVKLGLSDAIGTLRDAAREALRLANGDAEGTITDPQMVYPPKKLSFPEIIENMQHEGTLAILPKKFQTMSLRYQAY
jgi:protease-4